MARKPAEAGNVQADGPPNVGEARKRKKLISGLVGGGVLVAVAVVVLAKSGGMGADEAAAREAMARAEPVPTVYHELELTKIKAPNEQDRDMLIYELKVAVRVEAEKLALAKELIARRRFAIEDAFNRVIRSAAPEDLKEKNLQWLREQLLSELIRVAEDEELFDDLYIPQFMKFTAN